MPIDLSVPKAPDPTPQEIWSGTPNVVVDGERYAIGWQRFSDEDGGPAYVTARRGILGGRRVVGRYPLTEGGWSLAWTEFSRLDPATAEKTRFALARRSAEAARLRTAWSGLTGLVLSAVDPPGSGFAIGQAYDLRVGEDGLRITRLGSQQATAEYRYADVVAVQVTGFHRVPPSLGQVLFFSRLAWLDDDPSEYRTHLRVQASDRVMDFRDVALPSGEDLGRWLEPVNRAIREGWLSAAADKSRHDAEWLLSELSRLAERFDRGTLASSDFDLLRARLTGGY